MSLAEAHPPAGLQPDEAGPESNPTPSQHQAPSQPELAEASSADKPGVFAFMMNAQKKLQTESKASPPAALASEAMPSADTDVSETEIKAKPKRRRTKQPMSESTGKKPRKSKQQTLVQPAVLLQPELPLAPPPPTPRLSQEQPPPSSSAPAPESPRTDIDPITAAAPLPYAPASSPPPGRTTTELPEDPIEVFDSDLPAPLESVSASVSEADIDPNHGRRKRRKPTPQGDRVKVCVELSPSGRIMTSPDTRLRRRRQPVNYSDAAAAAEDVEQGDESDSSVVSYHRSGGKGILKIRAGGRIRPEHLLPSDGGIIPSSPLAQMPMVPASSPPPMVLSRSGSSASHRPRATASYDRESGILTIRSSPVPEPMSTAPAATNAFALLGKKKQEPPSEPKAEKEKPAKKERKPRGKKGKAGKDLHQETLEENLSAIVPAPKPDALPLPPPPEDAAMPDAPPPAALPEKLKPPPKAPHPFFSVAGRKKMAVTTPNPDSGPAEASTSTPPQKTSPKKSPPRKQPFAPTFGSTFRTMPKTPGLIDAPWPPPGTAHVRGLEDQESPDVTHGFRLNRKLKDSVVVSAEENILAKFARDLKIGQLADEIRSPGYYEHEFLTIPEEVRLPERLLTTGSELQEMVRTRVSARLPHPNAPIQLPGDSDSDAPMETVMKPTPVHPSLLRLYRRLREELTPFDELRYETVPWEQKYAPIRACEVLQPDREMEILSQWLHGQRTDSLDTGKIKRKNTVLPKLKKKRKKKDDLDGFIVSELEAQDEMSELTEPEDTDWISTSPKAKRSSVRTGDAVPNLDVFFGLKPDEKRKTNTVLISGPVGCGKTAAVYAVAKELGYTVFEVNAGSRRGGKDVLDAVGDMSRNHLVHQAKASAAADNPFALAKATARKALDDETQGRAQTQSLILLEEVDLLFEEDKTFWNSVLTLMQKSKRPIIMTANDETLVPLDTFSVHAILRFVRPPQELATDYLLLLAANEGHLLEREAVRTLLQGNRGDVRRSIMDLQFHCRFGVGDRTGGLTWHVTRYPPGSDLTPTGERLRVVSTNTYRPGMGWYPRSPDTPPETLWSDLLDEFALSIEDLTTPTPATTLHTASLFSAARSAADAASLHSLSPTPHLSPTTRDPPPSDTPLGHPPLHTPTHAPPLSRAIALTTFSLTTTPTDPLPAILRARTHPAPPTPFETQTLLYPLTQAHPRFAASSYTAHCAAFQGATQLLTEVAPVVRGIVRKDVEAEKRRRYVAGMMTVGGRRTRAARTAAEGGERGRERWLRVGAGVLRSAGERWGWVVDEVLGREGAVLGGSAEGAQQGEGVMEAGWQGGRIGVRMGDKAGAGKGAEVRVGEMQTVGAVQMLE